VNDRFLQMLQYSRDEFLRNEIDWKNITPQEFWDQDARITEELVRTSSCDPFEKEFIRKDGSRMAALVSAAGIEEELFVTSIVDLSQQKHLAGQIQDLNKNLEQRVKERTEELLLVNKELESFTYTVSHDLRAPLRAIHGYSQILFDEHAHQLNYDAHRILCNVQSNAKKMGQLVDDLLTFSRMSKRGVKLSHVNLNMIVDNVLSALTGRAQNQLRVKVQSLGTVMADSSLIQLVFQNLIENAIKYTSKTDDPFVEVGLMNIDDTDTYFVKDNGAGFDMRYYNKLFGVFQRLHTEDEFDGTGVGLAIVYRIISKHGGRVWAEAGVNKGATFYFTLSSGVLTE
jgi:light-regulated signal transduction histidine kinase (bacteriophytochrome)